MFILFIFLLLVILIFGLYYLFRLGRWTFKKKTRVTWALAVIVAVSFAYLIDLMVFTKMELIQSKVYPDLYLVKNPVTNKDSINSVINKLVLEKVNSEYLNHNGALENSKNRKLPYRLRFYQYYTGTSLLVPFGEAGTTHFIENKENPGGFNSEEITHYSKYRIAEFNLNFCKDDSLNYLGTISYYQDRKIIKTDTIINQCQTIKSSDY